MTQNISTTQHTRKRGAQPTSAGVQTSTPEKTKDGEYLILSPQSIYVGNLNPRRTFNEERLTELTNSVREKGVLEPLLVRPLQKPKGNMRHELVAGERRLKAAIRAKLKDVPVISRAYTDQEALEIAVVENEQRDDVPVLEKAEGYQRLMKEYGYSAEALAARINKSEAHVHATIKLLAIPEIAKKALDAGHITKSHAEIIARVPNQEGRERLAGRILYGHESQRSHVKNPRLDVCSVRDAKNFAESFTKELSKAKFDTTDATLVPDMGACTTCPFKSGNNRLEYPEGRADICNNVPCFDKKTEAGRARQLAALTETKGAIPLSKEEVKKFLPYGFLYGGSPYIELKDCCHQDKGKYRTFRQLVGKELGKSVRLFVALHERDGSIVELARRSEVNEVLKRVHGFDLNARAGSGKEEAARRLRSLARSQVVFKVLAVVADSFRKQSTGGFSAKFDKQLRLAAPPMIHNVSNDALRDVSKRRGVVPKGQYPRFADELEKVAATLKGPELFGLLMEVGIASSMFNWKGPYSSTVNKRTQEVLKAAGVDLSALENAEIKAIKEKRAERERKAKENKAKKAKKAGAKAAKGKG